MNALIVEFEARPEALILKVKGDAGVAQADELHRAFTRAVAHRGKFFIIDMSRVNFMSSLGMGMMVEFNKGVTLRGGKTLWAAMQEPVADAFRRARLDRALTMVPTMAEALRLAGETV